MIDLAIDSGCANIKLAYKDNDGIIQTIITPSLCRSGEVMLSLINEDIKDKQYFDEFDSPYVVGVSGDGFSDTRSDNYPFSTNNKVLTCDSVLSFLINKGLPLDTEINLTSGLPLDLFYSKENGKSNVKRIEQKHNMVDNNNISWDKKNCLQLKSNQICPESISGWIDFCFDDNGLQRQSIDNDVVIVDIGGRTVDISRVTPSFQLRPKGMKTIKAGVLYAYHNLENEIGVVGSNSLELLKKAFEVGYIVKSVVGSSPEKIDITKKIHKVKKQQAEEIMQSVNLIAENGGVAGICLLGGGAEFFKNEIEQLSSHNVYIPENPITSNVKGYLKIAGGLTVES